jgi:DNA polymerase I-like protein with 3'-5' exonuclease and polymerase domains
VKPKNKCWIVTKNQQFFKDIKGFENENYEFCALEDMVLPKRIAYDSETTGLSALSDEIFAIQLGTGTNNYLIDLQNYSTTLKFKEYEGLTITLEEVIPYFIDKELVGQNIVFDLGFLNIKNYFPKIVFDTYIQSKIFWNGAPPNVQHGFGAIMERELGIKYDKTDQKNISTVKLSQLSTIQYSFNDVDRLLEAHDSLWKKLEQQGSLPAYLLHCRHARALSYMQLCGLPISTHKWKAKMQHDEKQMKLLAQQIKDYIWENLPQFRDSQIDLFDTSKRIKVLLSSPTQMIKVFQAFGINTKNDEGKDSINETIIQKSKHEFVKLWLNFQEFSHRCSTFGDNILKKVINNRIYTSFNQIINTARMSTRKGEINFLNFPSDKNTRECFVANKGFKMICCDYEGQENICNVDKTRDKAMLEAVLSGSD